MTESAHPDIHVRGAVDLSALQAANQKVPADRPTPAAGGYVVDLTEESFSAVVQRSTEVPVLIYLWVNDDQGCVTMADTLGNVVESAQGRLLLGRVDVQAWPRIAAAFQVQDVPAVVGLIGGQPVPLFAGVQDAQTIASVLDQFLQAAAANGVTGVIEPQGDPGQEPAHDAQAEPEPLPPLHQEAFDAIERNDFDTAIAAYTKALKQDPKDTMAAAGLAQVSLLQRTASVDLGEVRSHAANAPDDVDAQLAVADVDMIGGKVEDALDRLISLIPSLTAEDRERVRVRVVDYFEILGADDLRVAPARRRLASALF